MDGNLYLIFFVGVKIKTEEWKTFITFYGKVVVRANGNGVVWQLYLREQMLNFLWKWNSKFSLKQSSIIDEKEKFP